MGERQLVRQNLDPFERLEPALKAGGFLAALEETRDEDPAPIRINQRPESRTVSL